MWKSSLGTILSSWAWVRIRFIKEIILIVAFKLAWGRPVLQLRFPRWEDGVRGRDPLKQATLI